jgi:hypothetical protein
VDSYRQLVLVLVLVLALIIVVIDLWLFGHFSVPAARSISLSIFGAATAPWFAVARYRSASSVSPVHPASVRMSPRIAKTRIALLCCDGCLNGVRIEPVLVSGKPAERNRDLTMLISLAAGRECPRVS